MHSDTETPAPAESEKRFTPEDAEAILLSRNDGKVNIGGRDIEILPLNFFATKAVWTFIRDIIKPLFRARVQYNRDLTAWAKAQQDDPMQTAIEMPFPSWWMEPIEKVFDDIVALVTLVLQRTDPSITVDWVKQHIEPMIFLQDFLPVVMRQNRLDSFIKKALENEAVQAMMAGMASKSPTASGSTESSPTSAGTTPASTPTN